MQELDFWIAAQEPRLSRPEAIRRLIEQGLAHTGTLASPEQRAKAIKLAARELSKIDPKLLTPAEQRRRRRSLIRGPKELRGADESDKKR